MCAGGLPFPSEGHPVKMIEAAFEIAEFIEESRKLNDSDITHFDVRIGVTNSDDLGILVCGTTVEPDDDLIEGVEPWIHVVADPVTRYAGTAVTTVESLSAPDNIARQRRRRHHGLDGGTRLERILDRP